MICKLLVSFAPCIHLGMISCGQGIIDCAKCMMALSIAYLIAYRATSHVLRPILVPATKVCHCWLLLSVSRCCLGRITQKRSHCPGQRMHRQQMHRRPLDTSIQLCDKQPKPRYIALQTEHLQVFMCFINYAIILLYLVVNNHLNLSAT